MVVVVGLWVLIQGTLLRPVSPFATLSSPNYSFNANGGPFSPGSAHSLSFVGASEQTLVNSPVVPSNEALAVLQRPRNLTEKARLNAGCVHLRFFCPVC